MVGEAVVGVVALVVAPVVTARLELEHAGVKLTGEEQGESTYKKMSEFKQIFLKLLAKDGIYILIHYV